MKSKNLVNGWFFLDKPIGMTSNLALQKIRKKFNNCKAGFVGTLDPLASGNLPIALGNATKIISYIEKVNKKYLFTIEWGLKTDTGDLEGDIIERRKIFPNLNNIKKVLLKFTGGIKQEPPKFSSVKINGIRAYKLARDKVPFSTNLKKIFIRKIKLLSVLSKERAFFYVECSSGTYIRSLAEDIAFSLGTLGTVTELRRIGFGQCNKKLISLDYLVSLRHSDELNKLIHPVDVILNEVNEIQLSELQVKKLLTGQFVEIKNFFEEMKGNKFAIAKYKKKVIAIGLIEKSFFYPKKLLIT